MSIVHKDIKLQWGGCLVSKGGGGDVFMPNGVVQPKFWQKYTDRGKKNVIIINYCSIRTKTSENYFYMVNLYFPCTFKAFGLGVVYYRPFSVDIILIVCNRIIKQAWSKSFIKDN